MTDLDALELFLQSAKSPLSFLDGTPEESRYPDNQAIGGVFDFLHNTPLNKQDADGHWPTQSAATLLMTIAEMRTAKVVTV